MARSVVDPDALRAARIRHQWTQHALAVRCGLATDALVSRWERGTATPHPAAFLRLATELQTPPASLLIAELREEPDLRAHRTCLGLSAADLSERSGIPVSTLSALERGAATTPQAATLTALAAALGIQPEHVTRLVRRAARLQDLNQT